MRILFLNRSASSFHGEMNQYVIDVAARLKAEGDTVALIHARDGRATFDGTRYVFDHLDEMRRAPDDVRVRLEAIVEDFQPDVIQIHGAANAHLDQWLARLAPTARFIHNHQFYCSGGRLTLQHPQRMCNRPHGPGCLIHHYARSCGSLNPGRNLIRYSEVSRSLAHLRTAPFLQVAGGMMRENLVRNGIEPDRIEVLPLYAPAPAAKGPEIVSRRRIILHPGGMVPNKGVWLMAKGINAMPPDVDLVFGGSGELEEAMADYVKQRSLSERVRVMGDLGPEQWSRLYHQADLVVYPSMWNEPLGLAGMHAMAHARPVIAFQSFGVNEWMIDGITGHSVPFGDRRAFLSRVTEAFADPAKLRAMGQAGRRVWEERFRPAHHIKRLRAFYERMRSQ